LDLRTQKGILPIRTSERRIELSEPPLTRPISPDEQRGFPPPEDWGQMRMNAKKKEKTRRETTAIKVWVTPAEKAAITVKADAYSLSASTYLRELALRSTRPPTRPGEKINHRGKRTDLQRVRTKC